VTPRLRRPIARRGVITNALTIDLEDWYHGVELPPSRWSEFEDRLVPATERLLEILDGSGVRATFFVLGDVAERHPGLVTEIHDRGHEIGTHGCSHRFVYEQGSDEFRADVRRSLALLEGCGCTDVIGHRAPYFSITQESLWALDVLAGLGLRYDSSIFPISNYRYGIPGARQWPHRVNLNGQSLVEFPISTWRVAGRSVPVAGGAYFRLLPYAVTRRGIATINRSGNPAVFYLHPWELDPAHPRIRLPRRIALTHYANLGATERRLTRLLGEFSFAPVREVLDVA
jgi:polysaccharide deacetylase family protein (PEP-CTERM system associated)